MTTNVVCIKHPCYDGSIAPLLGCKTCCMIFLAVLKLKQKENPESQSVSGPENQ